MVQQDAADDYVIGTGEAHSVQEFVERSFQLRGTGLAKARKDFRALFSAAGSRYLIADTTKTRTKLGWEARIKFHDLVAIMVDADLEALGLKSPGRGKTILEEKIGPWNRWHNSVIRVAQAVQGQAQQH